MPVPLLLLALSRPLPLPLSDWLLWCSSRVTGLCGPWSSSALTACYLHGDGWLRRCRAMLLTTAEDREHTWDTSPSPSLGFSLSLSIVSLFLFPLPQLFAFQILLFCFLPSAVVVGEAAAGLHDRFMSFSRVQLDGFVCGCWIVVS